LPHLLIHSWENVKIFFLLWNRGHDEATFLLLRLFQKGFFFSSYNSKDFILDRSGEHKEAFSSACRLLETPSHPTEIRKEPHSSAEDKFGRSDF
jgi:hypothetical protein